VHQVEEEVVDLLLEFADIERARNFVHSIGDRPHKDLVCELDTEVTSEILRRPDVQETLEPLDCSSDNILLHLLHRDFPNDLEVIIHLSIVIYEDFLVENLYYDVDRDYFLLVWVETLKLRQPMGSYDVLVVLHPVEGVFIIEANLGMLLSHCRIQQAL